MRRRACLYRKLRTPAAAKPKQRAANQQMKQASRLTATANSAGQWFEQPCKRPCGQ